MWPGFRVVYKSPLFPIEIIEPGNLIHFNKILIIIVIIIIKYFKKIMNLLL